LRERGRVRGKKRATQRSRKRDSTADVEAWTDGQGVGGWEGWDRSLVSREKEYERESEEEGKKRHRQHIWSGRMDAFLEEGRTEVVYPERGRGGGGG
jgi:hypothetical protein